jgi:prophage regulatory protein
MELDRILRLPELLKITGLSSATIYRMIAKGTFPQAVVLGANSRGWRASSIRTWLESLEDAGPRPAPAASEPQGVTPRKAKGGLTAHGAMTIDAVPRTRRG